LEADNGAVKHSGDNRTGEGEGDDEVITIALDNLSSTVKVIVFVVACYNEGGNFKSVETAKATIRDITSS
jgi:tellurium resistance protein TerZ